MRELKGTAAARPLRVAFLLEEGPDSHAILDAIFAASYGWWGGRFSLIVPCNSGKISTKEWEWLRIYDPDIIYSYCELAECEIDRINLDLSVSLFRTHPDFLAREAHQFRFKPDLGVEPLSSLSVIYTAARYPRSTGRLISVLDSWYGHGETRFITDNFGTYHRSRGTNLLPTDARAVSTLYMLAAEDDRTAQQQSYPPEFKGATTEEEVLEEIASRNVTPLSALSSMYVPRMELLWNGVARSFGIVIGSSFNDRVLFWNSRHYYLCAHDTNLVGLIIDEKALGSESLMVSLSRFLSRRTVSSTSSNQPAICVRSTSLDSKRLAALAECIGGGDTFIPVRSERITGWTEMLPEDEHSAAIEGRRSAKYGSFVATAPFEWQGSRARPPHVRPKHLDHGPNHQSFTSGVWACDLGLEVDADGPSVGSTQNWELPRRWRLEAAFRVEYREGTVEMPARATATGELSTPVSESQKIAWLDIPEPSEAISTALVASRWGVDPGRRERTTDLPPLAHYMTASNEAAYFRGVVGMAGDLDQASAFLLHPFWLKQFAQVGATATIADTALDRVAKRVRAHFALQQTFSPADPDDCRHLAEIVIKEAHHTKLPAAHLNFDDLKEEWDDYRNAYWTRVGRPDELPKWNDRDAATLEWSLQSLRKRKMLFQGHHWICGNCSHRNWVTLGAYDSELRCEICRAETPFPVAPPTLFRVNGFLLQALRDRSVRSTLWLLTRLRREARRSLLYLPSSVLWFDRARKSEEPEAEVDLIGAVDGQTFICELKPNWASLKEKDVRGLVYVAKRLRPHFAIVAVMEDGTKKEKLLREARNELLEHQITLRVIHYSPDNFYDGPCLPYQ